MISDKEMRKRIADMSPQELLKASETFEALFDLVHQHDDNSIENTNPDYYKQELARLTAELAELRERFDVTDDLLNQATVTIRAVIACCTYNSNEDAKIGIYGISPDAFTRIDKFITNYNHAVSAGKVSVDVKPVKRDLSDADQPANSDVSMTQDVLIDSENDQSIEI